MREIKFRVWDRLYKKMKYDDDIGYEPGDLQVAFLSSFFSDPNFEWMQFTGLKDKNGKEIYEADVVRHFDEISGSVQWSGYGMGKNRWIPAYTDGKRVLVRDADNVCEYVEIIGNIYENPELLK